MTAYHKIDKKTDDGRNITFDNILLGVLAYHIMSEHKYEYERLIGETECARLLSITPQTLARWRKSGKGPAFACGPNGRAIRYNWPTVQRWLEAQTKHTTKSPAAAKTEIPAAIEQQPEPKKESSTLFAAMREAAN